MRSARIIIVFFTLSILLACGGGKNEQKALDPDLVFCNSVAHGSLMLVELGKLSKGTDLENKGQMLVPTFDSNYYALRGTIIQKSKILYPKALPQEKLKILSDLKNQNGSQLTQALNAEIHNELLFLQDAYQTVQEAGRDEDIKRWAAENFHVVQQSLAAFP